MYLWAGTESSSLGNFKILDETSHPRMGILYIGNFLRERDIYI